MLLWHGFCKNRKNSEEKYNIHREFSGCITVLLRIVWFYNSVEQNDRCMAPRIYSSLLYFPGAQAPGLNFFLTKRRINTKRLTLSQLRLNLCNKIGGWWAWILVSGVAGVVKSEFTYRCGLADFKQSTGLCRIHHQHYLSWMAYKLPSSFFVIWAKALQIYRMINTKNNKRQI